GNAASTKARSSARSETAKRAAEGTLRGPSAAPAPPGLYGNRGLPTPTGRRFHPPPGGPRPRHGGGTPSLPPPTPPPRAPPPRRPHTGPALARAFAETRPDLVRALSAFLGNGADAHDAAQEAFLKCWRARARLPAVRDLRAWIFRVGFNAARDLRRDA